MKPYLRPFFYLFLLVVTSILFSGCLYKQPVRHLTSEVSLIIPNKTTHKELISFMGFPEQKRSISATEEEWLYYQANKSFLRRAPLLGNKFGLLDYDVAIIQLNNLVVTSSQYRSLTEEEFKQLGISESDQ